MNTLRRYLLDHRGLVGAMLCGLLFCLPLLRSVPSEMPLHPDLMDLIATAKDCAEARGCNLKLTPGAPHGAGFVHFLAVVFLLGGDIFHAHLIAFALIGFAFTLLALAVLRTYGESSCYLLLPLLLMAPTLGIHLEVPTGEMFWNPMMVPIAALLFAAGACRYLATWRLRYLAVAALGASLGPYFHLAAAMLLPALLLLALLNPRRRLGGKAVVAGLLALAIVQLGYAASTLGHSQWLWLPARIEHETGAAGASLAALAGRLLSPLGLAGAALVSFKAPGPLVERQSVLFFLVTHIPFYIIIATLGDPAAARSQYSVALLPGTVVLASLTVVRLWRLTAGRSALIAPLMAKAPHAAVAAMALLVCVESGPRIVPSLSPLEPDPALLVGTQDDLTMDDIKTVAEHLGEQGWRHEELAGHLHGSDRINQFDLFRVLAIHFHQLGDEIPEAPPEHDVEILVMTSDEVPDPLPEDVEIVLARGELAVGVRQFSPSLDWDEFLACTYYPGAKQEACHCNVIPRVALSGAHMRDRFRLSNQIMKRVWGVAYRPAAPAFRIVAVSIAPPGETGPRELIIPSASEIYPCQGAFLRVGEEGADRDLPATRIALPSGDAGGAGRQIVFAWDLSSELCREANTPLPLPSVMDRPPGLLPAEITPAAPVFDDPALVAELLECVDKSALETEARAPTGYTLPEPLVPRWHVIILTLLLATGFAISAVTLARPQAHSRRALP